jgi:hypothetical protein
MQITNTHNLPEPIFKAVSAVWPIKPHRYSVTDLIGPPLIRQLKIKHFAERVEDASDRLWLLLGKAMHHILDAHASVDAFAEEKLVADHNGYQIVGVSDTYKAGIITDYKVTSVWSWVYAEDKDWEQQLNIYAWLWQHTGFTVYELWIRAILRDWTKRQVKDDYPPIPFVSKRIRLWPHDEAQAYINERLRLHTATEVPACTPEEMWEKPTTYAVKKKKRKKALRVLDTKEEAEAWMAKNEKADWIEVRPGERVRCRDYCPVKQFCPNNIYRDSPDAHLPQDTEPAAEDEAAA